MSIHMGDDTQIRAEGEGSIKLKHAVFINVLSVPSLATNVLYVYQMTHTGPLKRVVFGPNSVEITNTSTRNIIVKGVANHDSKAYEFSHFLPYSDLVQSQQPFEREGKNISSTVLLMIHCLKFQIQKMRNKINMILILRVYLKMN